MTLEHTMRIMGSIREEIDRRRRKDGRAIEAGMTQERHAAILAGELGRVAGDVVHALDPEPSLIRLAAFAIAWLEELAEGWACPACGDRQPSRPRTCFGCGRPAPHEASDEAPPF